MRAWTVDADDIRVAEDFDESLLHRTPEIDSFLTPDRDDKFIVIATKGFGMTVLLRPSVISIKMRVVLDAVPPVTYPTSRLGTSISPGKRPTSSLLPRLRASR